jgi:arabinan endo-1,5-alpha-L-arabinosidase
MNLTSWLRLSTVALAVASGPGFFQASSPASPKAFQLEGDVEGTHDPSIIKDGDTWHLFATVTVKDSREQIPIRCSKDLHRWKNCGFVFSQIPDWIKKESPETKDLWAPDISFFNGMYHLYYAFSIFGKNTSGIALLTNKTLDPQSASYRWKDEGLVVRSVASDDFNAIDPNLILDEKGGAWLAFGSFWSGIKMRRLDLNSGKLDPKDAKWYSLASRSHGHAPEAQRPDLPPDSQAIEAPFIVRHAGYYYLFVSFDLCCRGTKSDYKTMVGRSTEVMGPYMDATGRPMLQGGGTLLLSGNERWVGPGGESILQDKDQDIMVFHAYDAKSGRPSLQISSIAWTSGWPQVALEGNRESK